MQHISPSTAQPALWHWFMRQIGDRVDTDHVLELSYAMGIILPLTGWARSDFVKRLRESIDTPRNRDIILQQMQMQKSGQFSPYQLALQSIHGSTVIITVSPRPLMQNNGETLVTATLYEEKTSKEQQGFHSEWLRLLSLLDRLPAFVCLVAPDYSMHYTNRAFREHFGNAGDRPCYLAIRGRQAPCDTCAPFDVFETGSLSICEWTSPEDNRSYRIYSYPFDDTDGPPMALLLGMDITQSKRMQEKLTLSEERYRSIADNLAMGIAVLDRNQQITAANPMFTKWFGDRMTTDAQNCQTIFADCEQELPHDDETTFPVNCIERTFADGSVHDQTLICSKGQEYTVFRVTTCPIISLESEGQADNDVQSVIIMVDDITERRKMDERLHRARKLEAMGTLAAGIAHEINQPLSAIHLYAGGLEMLVEQHREVPQETLLTRLSWILREAETIRDIVSHMRALVLSEDAPPVTPSSINDAVTRSLGLIGAQLSAHGIDIRLQLQDNLPLVMANAVQLEQVAVNLIVNAMHALDTLVQQDKWIRVTTSAIGEESVQMVIADNGPGLSGLGDSIFDPFFTTKAAAPDNESRTAESTGQNASGNHQEQAHTYETGSSMGLGLSIVHIFVDSWGGEIAVSQSPETDHGACFTITLPQAHPPAGENDANSDS